MVNELRKDYILDRWAIIAGNRGKRPSDFIQEGEKEDDKTCFFCPGQEECTPPEISRIPGGKTGWRVRCFPNKFPALIPETGDATTGLLESRPAYGRHEIVVETPGHGKTLTDLSVKHMCEVLDMYIQRLDELYKDKRTAYVSVFKNHGRESGASLTHSHTQIITTPITPPLLSEKMVKNKQYEKEHGVCGYCDIARREAGGERMIIENRDYVSIAPYASRFPFETWIIPKRHLTDLRDADDKTLGKMAKILLGTLGKIRVGLSNPAYNLMLFQSPRDGELHLHWEIAPRISRWAGFEVGTEIIINTMPPEEAARHLRNA